MMIAFLAFLWVIAATVVAFLPMGYQYVPGFGLLLMAPPLIVALGREFGWILAAIGVLAFVSMFRRPLFYLLRRALGGAPAPGKEEEA